MWYIPSCNIPEDMNQALDPRQRRGQELAKDLTLKREGDAWLVASRTSPKKYLVDARKDHLSCTCPDFEKWGHTGQKCKHIFAVQVKLGTEAKKRLGPEPPKPKYKQAWPAYNLAQTHEKDHVAELLASLCEGIVDPPQTRGRPRIPLGQSIFAAVMKVYGTTTLLRFDDNPASEAAILERKTVVGDPDLSTNRMSMGTTSGRRSLSDMRTYQERGFLEKAPHFNSISNTLEDSSITSLLTILVEQSAAPLVGIEHDFASDASGFATTTYNRWFDEKYGREKSKQKWVKAHIVTGVVTNVVTSVKITDAFVNDYIPFEENIRDTAKRFTISEVSADKAYIGQGHLEFLESIGAQAFIPFKSNTTGEGSELWKKAFHFFMYNREEFKAKYHKRSNVETTFSMMKAKFGAFVRSKSDTAQVNEVLCKILCHNLCVLVQCIYELGIEPEFWKVGEAA